MNPEALAQIPETLTYQDGDKTIAYRDHQLIKDAPDIGSLAKMVVDGQRELGSRIPTRLNKDNVVEVETWRKTHMPKLYEMGVLTAPPATPEAYDDVVVKPAELPEGFGWNDDVAKELKTVAHKYGISKSAMPELLALHQKAMTGVATVLKTTEEAGTAALKLEYGDKYDELRAATTRLVDHIFQTPEELALFEKAGWGNHPGFLKVLMRLAPLVQQDSSFFAKGTNVGGGTGAATHDQIRAELADISSNKANPRNAGYWRNDKEVMAYVDSLYKKVFGDAKVEIL